MRTSSLAIACLGAGCSAALPPPQPPHFHGTVAVSGGALGSWQLTPSVGTPVDHGDVEALDLTDPTTPGHVLRLTRSPAEPEQRPRGIQEMVASRGVELRLATTTTPASEVVLDREHCARLDAIFRFTHGHAFGSARFDCDLGASGRATGDVEFAAGSVMLRRDMTGHLEASDATFAGVQLHPDEAETDPRGVMFWDRRHPRVVFELEQQTGDPSVLGAGSNATLRVISTAASVKSFDLAPSACRALKLDRIEDGYVRIGTHQHTSWSGTIELDCTTPSGGRLTGSLELL